MPNRIIWYNVAMDRLVNEIVQRPDLKKLVEQAFENRREDVFSEYENEPNNWNDPIVKQGYVNESIENGKRLGEIISPGNEDEIVKFPPFTPKPNLVTVDDLKDYHWLLRYAAEVVFNYTNNQLIPETRRKLLKKDLSHEFQHALAGKGEEGLKIKYGVGFFESPDKKSVSWKPTLVLTGKARRGTIRKIVEGASWLSKTDQVALGK
jgi:hypothetical protein